MNCAEFREMSSEHLDGALPPDAAARFEAHLGACSSCASLMARLREVVAALESFSEPAPARLAENVLARVPHPIAPARRAGAGWSDLRRVAGWGLVLLGAAWQVGMGDLAARALGHAAPVIAEARETVERTRHTGLAQEIERTSAGVAGLARGFASARRVLNPPDSAGTHEGT